MKYALLIIVIYFFTACAGDESRKSVTVGATKILVDESFAPIIEDQLIVYDSSYPQAKIELVYKPEIHLLNILLKDSIDVAIMSRKLLPHEAKFYESRNIIIRTLHIATDAVAFITDKTSLDSTITVDEVKGIMQGSSKGRNLIFDNANSSTVRYLKELAKIKELPKSGVYALQNNDEVIKYVHNNPGTIGVIGINWMKQPPKELEPVVEKLKVMSVKNSKGLAGSDKFYKPTQNNLALGLYPLSRELYIINGQGGSGVGTGFAAFIASERGQRIILKSGLLPDKIPSREIFIK
ncbi:MAG: substrate-binding domain-containing protein [Sphingobacteriaceae bacterium]|nr:substrate-binding domain-containing protein [Sphingobacteriaceae bacterium]